MYKFCLLAFLFFSVNVYAACNDTDRNASQMGMNLCSYEDYKHADAKLNLLYKKMMTALPKQEAENLKRYQQNWIKQIDKKCKEEGGDYEGGSMQALVVNSCYSAVTEKRNSELELQLAVRDAIAYLKGRDDNPYGDLYPNRKTKNTNFKDAFLESQKYWEKFKAYECEAYKATFHHHDEDGYYLDSCLTEQNNVRVKQIKETYLKN